MSTSASFLVVSDPAGDLDYIARSIELAVRKDLGAQAVFYFGNFVGSILTPEERAELAAARPVLVKELNDRRDHYEGLKVHDITQLGHHMAQNPANYRRTQENGALRTVRALVGLRDPGGRWTESGRALMRARRVYADAERFFKRSPIPVYVMADTLLAEEVIDASRWLHFAWFALGGVAIRALCMTSEDLEDGVPELAPGPRRGGKTVAVDEYPLAAGDVIFSPHINPVLHQLLSGSTGKFAVIRGDGSLDRSYHNVLVATQKRGTACLYKVDGPRIVRRGYPYDRNFGDPTVEEFADVLEAATSEHTSLRRRELEEQAKLAGLGSDLIRFVDMVRIQNPGLARDIERSGNRVEAILRYVREMEEQGRQLADLLSTQRAGLERLVKALEPFIGDDATGRAVETLTVPPERQHDVPTWDSVNASVASIIVEALKARQSGNGSPE